MVQEKNAEAVEAQAEVVEPKVPAVEELTSQIATLNTELEAAKREAKSHQEYGRKTKEELDRQRGLDTKVSGLETRLQVVADMIASIMDAGAEEEPEQPKKRRSEEYLARLNKEVKEVDPKQEDMRRAVVEADGLIKSVGLEMDKSPETRMAYLLFRVGDYEAGLEEVRKVVEAKKPVQTEAKKEDFDKAVQDAARNLLKEQGLLVSDEGGPSAGSASFREAERKYAAGEMSTEAYRKIREKERLI